jgi:hypothetical protein
MQGMRFTFGNSCGGGLLFVAARKPTGRLRAAKRGGRDTELLLGDTRPAAVFFLLLCNFPGDLTQANLPDGQGEWS